MGQFFMDISIAVCGVDHFNGDPLTDLYLADFFVSKSNLKSSNTYVYS